MRAGLLALLLGVAGDCTAARLAVDQAIYGSPLLIVDTVHAADGGLLMLGRRLVDGGQVVLVKADAQGSIVLRRELEEPARDGNCSRLEGPMVEDAAGHVVVFGIRYTANGIPDSRPKALWRKMVEPCLARFDAAGRLVASRSYRLESAVNIRQAQLAAGKDRIALAVVVDSTFVNQPTPTGRSGVASSAVFMVRSDLEPMWRQDQRLGDIVGHVQGLAINPRTRETVLLFKSPERGTLEYPGDASARIQFHSDGTLEDATGSIRVGSGGNPVAGAPPPKYRLCRVAPEGGSGRCAAVPEALAAALWFTNLSADPGIARWSRGHFARWARMEWTGTALRSRHLALDPATREPRLRLISWSDELAALAHVDLVLPGLPASAGVVTREGSAYMIEDRNIEERARLGSVRVATATEKGVSFDEVPIPATLSVERIAAAARPGEVWIVAGSRSNPGVPRLLKYILD